MACVSNGHTGDANFSSSCLACCIECMRFVLIRQHHQYYSRFMHMNRINVFKIVELWQCDYQQTAMSHLFWNISQYSIFYNMPYHVLPAFDSVHSIDSPLNKVLQTMQNQTTNTVFKLTLWSAMQFHWVCNLF